MNDIDSGPMKRILKLVLCALIALTLMTVLPGQSVLAQTAYLLDWDSVNYPARSLNQVFSDVNSSGVDMTFTASAVSPSTIAELINLVNGTGYSGTGTNTVQSLVESVNFTNGDNQILVTVEFSIPVSDVSFTMHDIDRSELFNLWNLNWIFYFDFMDRVEFQALSSDGTTIVQPVFTNPGLCVELIGAVAQGSGSTRNDSSCYDLNNATTDRGDVTVTFPGEITRFQYAMGNVNDKTDWWLNFNPTLQRVGLGDITFNSSFDYGDLPDTYGTAGITAARHLVPSSPTIYLGSVIPDDEFVAQVSVDALGDGSDEDAFSAFPGIGVNLAAFDLSIPVVNNSGSDAYLDGWIDFNMDGVFSQEEYAAVIVANGQTSANLAWNSLPALTLGNTFARLRISSDNSQLNTATSAGTLPDGEVEDYSVVIQSATAVTLSSFAASSAQPGWLVVPLASLGMALSALLLFRKKRARLPLQG